MNDEHPIVSRLRRLGHHFEVIRSGDIDTLQARLGHLINADHPWFSFLRSVGILCTDGAYGMLSPDAVVEAHRAQETFYAQAVIGDQAEEADHVAKEQRFRSALIPFQYVHSTGDFYCFVTSNSTREGPLIVDIYHDDFELAGGAFTDSALPTPYTRSFKEHLNWLADMLESDAP